VHHISSAKEDYSDLIEDFEVERFFSDGGGFQPLFTSFQELEGTTSQIVEPQSQQAQRANTDSNTTSGNNSVRRVHPSSVHSVTNTNNKGPAKPPVAIPKHLQNTPYFVDYKKHASGAVAVTGTNSNKAVHGGGGGSSKVKKQPPNVKHKPPYQQQQQQDEDDDQSVESHPPNKK
jgi:hypothetical protein